MYFLTTILGTGLWRLMLHFQIKTNSLQPIIRIEFEIVDTNDVIYQVSSDIFSLKWDQFHFFLCLMSVSSVINFSFLEYWIREKQFVLSTKFYQHLSSIVSFAKSERAHYVVILKDTVDKNFQLFLTANILREGQPSCLTPDARLWPHELLLLSCNFFGQRPVCHIRSKKKMFLPSDTFGEI